MTPVEDMVVLNPFFPDPLILACLLLSDSSSTSSISVRATTVAGGIN